MSSIQYKLRARLWLYPGPGGWHFITLPKKQSAEIKSLFGSAQRGFGSLPVIASVGKTRWKTSLFYDQKAGAYLLPIKADVRKQENLALNDLIAFSVQFIP